MSAIRPTAVEVETSLRLVAPDATALRCARVSATTRLTRTPSMSCSTQKPPAGKLVAGPLRGNCWSPGWTSPPESATCGFGHGPPRGATVALALSSPDGNALFEVPRSVLVRFLRRTYMAVPRGREYEHLDVDAAVNRLFAGRLRHAKLRATHADLCRSARVALSKTLNPAMEAFHADIECVSAQRSKRRCGTRIQKAPGRTIWVYVLFVADFGFEHFAAYVHGRPRRAVFRKLPVTINTMLDFGQRRTGPHAGPFRSLRGPDVARAPQHALGSGRVEPPTPQCLHRRRSALLDHGRPRHGGDELPGPTVPTRDPAVGQTRDRHCGPAHSPGWTPRS